MIRLRPRITLRRLIVAVAFASLGFEAELWRRRYPRCQQLAERSAEAEAFHRDLATSHARIAALYREIPAKSREVVRHHHEQAMIFAIAARNEGANAERAANLTRSYRRAALYPWLTIAPEEHGTLGLSRPLSGNLEREADLTNQAKDGSFRTR